MSSSDVWYCTCTWRTVSVISTRIARNPLDVSVTRLPVSSRTSSPKTWTPAWRNASSVSAAPSTREPIAKSASPEPRGADREVGPARDHRLEDHRQLGRFPRPVAVERDDVAGAVLAREPVADPQRDAVAAVALEAGDAGAPPA